MVPILPSSAYSTKLGVPQVSICAQLDATTDTQVIRAEWKDWDKMAAEDFNYTLPCWRTFVYDSAPSLTLSQCPLWIHLSLVIWLLPKDTFLEVKLLWSKARNIVKSFQYIWPHLMALKRLTCKEGKNLQCNINVIVPILFLKII